MLYTIQPYCYHIEPVTEVIDGAVTSATITTWKYDEDQKNFNFEIQFPLEKVKENFRWETGSLFQGVFGDLILNITEIALKDNLLIIGGLKEKGNTGHPN